MGNIFCITSGVFLNITIDFIHIHFLCYICCNNLHFYALDLYSSAMMCVINDYYATDYNLKYFHDVNKL
jgi:hypothetical protein